MPTHRNALRSKVAHRLVLMFFLCALLPTGALAVLAFHQVSTELYEQSDRRLHRASKAGAMVLLGRMLAFESDLATLEPEGPRATPARVPPLLRKRFHRITAEVDGRRVPLLGDPLAPEPPPAGVRGARLEVRRDPDGSPRILLSRTKHLPDGRAAVLTGETTPDRLFDASIENALPPRAQYCALDHRGLVVHCSEPATAPALVAAWSAEGERGPSGRFDWRHGDEDRVAGYWSLFLKAQFGAPPWTFVVSEPEDLVLAPIASFQTIFPLVILFSLGLVALLGIGQVRRRLVPLEVLQGQTRRVAAGDFGAVAEVRSGDEFEELAASFNAMTVRLAEHFDGLRRLIEVDRAVLSAIDAEGVADAVLGRIGEVCPCDAVLLGLVDPDSKSGWRFTAADAAGGRLREPVLRGPGAGDRERLRSGAESLEVELQAPCPAYLAPLRRCGARIAVVYPLFAGREPAGLMALGYARPEDARADRRVYARQLADQAGVALANARVIEENRALAYYDSLTGLPNRLLFKERLEQALLEARRRGGAVAACLLDLDGFKRINDTFGHESGDELLRQVAGRLTEAIGEGRVARLGGDEFTIVLTGIERPERAARAAEKALEVLSRPFALSGREVFVTASLGIASFPTDGSDLETLVKNADAAMYHAKERGRNHFQFYTRSMNEAAMRRMELEGDLRRALAEEELRVHFQPVVEVATRRTVGAEALVRWQHPERGLVPPSEFIPLAEEIGLVKSIGEWVLRQACEQSGHWQRMGLPAVRVAVNLASVQLAAGDLVAVVQRALRDARIGAGCLGLELTESMIAEPDDRTLGTVQRLRTMGVELSIDDFGTGYSSLSYLKDFPMHNLKIDRSFIENLGRSPAEEAITRTIVAMARSLGLRSVAEGVETETQLAFLREAACDAAQGFLFAKPMPAGEFAKHLREEAREGP